MAQKQKKPIVRAMDFVGVSTLRAHSAATLKKLDAIQVIQMKGERLAVLLPYTAYMAMQPPVVAF